jgi:hypothetical protein
MAFSHGSKAVLKINDAGSVLRDFSPYLTQAGLSRQGDTAEVSHLGDTDKRYIPGLLDNTFPLQGIFDVLVDGWINGVFGLIVAYEYYPQGATTGLVKFVGTGLITRYDIEASVSDATKFTAEFQSTGPITRSLVP